MDGKCKRMPIVCYTGIGGEPGCAAGPTSVGSITEAFSGQVKTGLSVAIAFPAALILVLKY